MPHQFKPKAALIAGYRMKAKNLFLKHIRSNRANEFLKRLMRRRRRALIYFFEVKKWQK